MFRVARGVQAEYEAQRAEAEEAHALALVRMREDWEERLVRCSPHIVVPLARAQSWHFFRSGASRRLVQEAAVVQSEMQAEAKTRQRLDELREELEAAAKKSQARHPTHHELPFQPCSPLRALLRDLRLCSVIYGIVLCRT